MTHRGQEHLALAAEFFANSVQFQSDTQTAASLRMNIYDTATARFGCTRDR